MLLKFLPKTARIHTDEGCSVQRWQQPELWAESIIGANIRNMVNVRGGCSRRCARIAGLAIIPAANATD
jgi:hypothetical protein